MDAVEFLKKTSKFCDEQFNCVSCPLDEYCSHIGNIRKPEIVVAIVDIWEEPKQTSLIDKIKYSEQWQNAKCPEWVYKLIEAEEGK